MKITLAFLSAVCLACIFTGCETVSVTTNHDPSAHFERYRTYSLAPAAHGQRLSPTGDAALRDALRTELGKRGITEVTRGKADLAIVPHVFIERKVSVQEYTAWGYGYHGGFWPYGYGYYGMWPGAPMTYTDVYQYHEGTMVLDFVDTRTNKLVFRGTGTAIVGGAESNAEKIREGVAKMMEQYPAAASR